RRAHFSRARRGGARGGAAGVSDDSRAAELAPRALRQLLLLDGEDGAGLDLHIAHDALAAAHVGELDVVAPRLDAADAQAFVVIDLAVTIVLALVGTPLVLAGGRQIKLLHRVRRQVPEADAAAILRARRGGGETEDQRKAQRFRHGITPARRATGFAP